MAKRPKASVLAIGTELTVGQILNRNASSLSETLTQLGFEVYKHICVADDRGDIREALTDLTSHSLLCVVTGGLGPTSDDFTRESIADFVGRGLIYREASWNRIQSWFKERELPTSENNRQQCFFPESAHIIENRSGTADAFYLETTPCHLAVLPGPPREIQYVLKNGLLELIERNFGALTIKPIQESFYFVGVGESRLAEWLDREFHQLKNSPENQELKLDQIILGYRASPPHVEVKFMLQPPTDGFISGTIFSFNSKQFAFMERFVAEFKEFYVGKSDRIYFEQWVEALKRIKNDDPNATVVIRDGLGGSFLQTLLRYDSNFFQKSESLPKLRIELGILRETVIPKPSLQDYVFDVVENAFESDQYQPNQSTLDGLSVVTGPRILKDFETRRHHPRYYTSTLYNERRRLYYAELSLIHFAEACNKSL